MKIFISWSGDASHEVARALKEWLPNVIQPLNADDLFLSSEDIEKGVPWFQALGSVLDQCDFGILCLTPDNMHAPWILYEAGAVSKRMGSARVVPLLIGLENADLISPLSHLNACDVDKDSMRKLVVAVNGTLGGDAVVPAKLDRAFDAFWPEIAPRLQAALEKAKVPKGSFEHDVFLSAPMAAYADDAQFQAGRAGFKKVYDALTQDCGLRVYWAAANITTMKDYQTIDVSVQEDLAALNASRYFVLLYPQSLVTSALFEAGYALALKLPSRYFVRERSDLPFLMRELAGAVPDIHIHTRSEWLDYETLAARIKKQKYVWFPG